MKKQSVNINSSNGEIRGILTKNESDSLVIFVSGYAQVNNPHLGRNRRISDYISETHNIDTFRFDFNGIGESEGDFYDLNTVVMVENLKDVYNHFGKLYKNISFFTMSYGANILKRFLVDHNKSASWTLMISPVFTTINQHYDLKIEKALITDFPKIISETYLNNLKTDFNSNISYKDAKADFGKAFLFLGSEDYAFNLESAVDFAEANKIKFELVKNVNHGLAHVGDYENLEKNIEILKNIQSKIGELIRNEKK